MNMSDLPSNDKEESKINDVLQRFVSISHNPPGEE